MKLLKVEDPVWDHMVQMQRIDDDTKTTDVHLTCLDGFIPAHAFILRSVSPFFDSVFKSQGEDYPVVRNVILPDYKISQVRAVVQLIYSGSTSIDNEKEGEAVRAIMKDWDIENKGFEFQKMPANKGSKKPKQVMYYVYSPEEAKRQGIVNLPEPSSVESKMEKFDNSVASTSSSSIEQPQKDRSVSPETVVEPKVKAPEKRALRPRATLKKRLNAFNDDSEEEKNASSGGVTDGSEESEGSQRRRTKRTPRKATTSPVRSSGRPTRSTVSVSGTPKIPEIITSDNDDEGPHLSSSAESSSESDLEDGSPVRKGKKRVVKSKQSVASNNTPTPGPGSKMKLKDSVSDDEVEAPTLQTPSNNSSSDSDSEGSSDDVKSFYKNPNLFAEAAKVCGKCKKKYSNPKEASDCITERHKLVRCYFCFDVCDSTEKLFQHYGEKHKKAGRESTLLCPFCQQAVPYKSVSTHVISNHLFAAGKNKNVEQGRVGQVGRPSTLNVSANQAAPKRMKVGLTDEPVKKPDEVPEKEKTHESDDSDDNLMVSKSNMLIKKRSASGKMKVFLLEKDKH